MVRKLCLILILCAGCTPSLEVSAPPTAPSTSVTPSPQAPAQMGTPGARIATAIDISGFPEDLKVGDTVNFPAQVVFRDGSTDNSFASFYTPDHLFERTASGLRLLAPGRLTVTVRSLQNADIQETRSFVIRDPSAPLPTATPSAQASVTPDLNPKPSPISSATAPPSLATASTSELQSLQAYFPNFKVGMEWTYAIRLVGVAAGVSGTQQYPDPLPLAWGLEMTDTNSESGNAARVVAYLQENNNLGTVQLTVTAVTGDQVTLRRSLSTSLSGLANIPPGERSYTRETIGELYTNLLQQSAPAQRSLKRVESGATLTSLHVSPPEDFTVDVLSGSAPLRDGLHTEEELTLYMHPEKGMIRQVVNQRGTRQGYLSVDTALALYLTDLKGF